MFAVLFEVHPRTEKWENYLGLAKLLRPELEKIDGFVENIRYRSLTRPGWILSLSTWRDEAALIRWRSHTQHHDAQERGREEIFSDYHLRVGELTDKAEGGNGVIVTLIDGQPLPEDVGKWVAFGPDSDVFEAILTPGAIILLTSSPHAPAVPDGARLRRVRIIRDYGMYDRREAPQNYPDAPTRS